MEKKFSPPWHKKDLSKEISTIFHENLYEFYLVGGAVRSLLMNRDPYDLDFTTNATPTQVMSLFRKTIPTGIKHGTVTILWKREPMEVTTFRSEGAYSDARRPDEISYISDLREDLSRRDFTMNALAYDVGAGKLYDYFSGENDIQNKIIRAIGDPRKRFEEDALRILRACRFASELGFLIESKTLEAMKKLVKNINKLSAERIYKELTRTLMGAFPLVGLNLFLEIGFFDLYFKKEMQTELWEKMTLLREGETGFLGRLCLFCLSIAPEERLGFFKALKSPNLPKDTSLHISRLIEAQEPSADDKVARVFLHQLGRENLELYLEIQRTLLDLPEFESWQSILEKNKTCPLNINELALSGNDLMEKGKVGREIGVLLGKALEIVLAKPELNEKETLLGLLGF